MPSSFGNTRFILVLFLIISGMTICGAPMDRYSCSSDIIICLPDSTFQNGPFIPIPDSLSKKDAIILSQDKNLSYMIDNSNNYHVFLAETEVLHKQIKILTNKGLDDNSKVSLHVNKYFNIERFSIHIIKPDGTNLKVSTEIRSVQEPDDNLKVDEKHLRISIPNLEVGDIIDFDTKITSPTGFTYPTDIFINEEVPILHSSLTLRFKKGLITRISLYHSMPAPTRTSEKGDSTFTWVFPYLQAVPMQNHSIPANELPYVSYMISNITNPSKYGIILSAYDVPRSWGNIFYFFSRSVERPDPKSKKSEYYQQFLYEKLKGCDKMTNLQKFRKIFSFINDSVKLIESGRSKNFSSGYYLYNREIDYASLIVLYQDLFRSFNFQSFYVFARRKTEGEIDTSMISRHTYSKYFLAFKDEMGEFHFINLRGLNYKPDIDEIDWQYQGTQAFLVDEKKPFDYKMIELPHWTCMDNTKKIRGNVIIDVENNSLKSSATISLSGTESIHKKIFENYRAKDSLRFYFEKSLKEQFDGFKLENYQTAKNEMIFPFRDSITYTGTLTNIITRIDEGIYAFPLSSWLDHDETTTLETNRVLDYYLSSPYQETFQYNFIFPYPVKLINSKNLQCYYSTPYGNYILVVEQTDATTIRVESTYQITMDYIPKEDYSLLKEINNQWKNFKDSRLMIQKL
jgi:hypothetical protein